MADTDFLLKHFAGRMVINPSACILAGRLAREARHGAASKGTAPFILGISGAQGSGKTTISLLVQALLEKRHGLHVALLSLDDFYLTRFERQALAREVHPLCATRGVAGTHDIMLMEQVMDALASADPRQVTLIPRFDKLADDRLPAGQWQAFTGSPDVILVEGWCVGLTASALGRWDGPINALETECDPAGIWASWSKSCLRRYDAIWKRLDFLAGIMLPDMETVIASRLAQERGLQAQGGGALRAMDEAGVRRFVQHYERHTLALWRAFPQLADLLARRGDDFDYEILALPQT